MKTQPQQNQPLSFQDLMGLFSMLNNQTQQGIQGVNQLQEFQQRQQEQPFRMQVLENQATAPQLLQDQREADAKLAEREMILRALGQIQSDPLGGGGGNQAAILDALKQYGFNSGVPMQQQVDPMAKWKEITQ